MSSGGGSVWCPKNDVNLKKDIVRKSYIDKMTKRAHDNTHFCRKIEKFSVSGCECENCTMMCKHVPEYYIDAYRIYS